MASAGKVALVTGAGSGIGLAVAKALAAEGVSVLAADLHPPTAVPGCTPLALDVSDPAAWETALADVTTVDMLVACAGISDGHSIAACSPAQWRKVMAVNLDGAFLAVQHGAKRMPNGGSIVLVGSASGQKAVAGAAAYCVSKAGVAMLVKTAALEYKPAGIRINGIAPAGVATPMWQKTDFWPQLVADKGSEQAAWEALGGVDPAKPALHRMAFADEVAQAILFLLGPHAAHMTGVMLPFDAGYTL